MSLGSSIDRPCIASQQSHLLAVPAKTASHSPDHSLLPHHAHLRVLNTPTKHAQACDDPYQSTSKYLAGKRIWRGRVEDMPVIKILHVCSVSSEDPVRKLKKKEQYFSLPSSKICLFPLIMTLCMMDITISFNCRAYLS